MRDGSNDANDRAEVAQIKFAVMPNSSIRSASVFMLGLQMTDQERRSRAEVTLAREWSRSMSNFNVGFVIFPDLTQLDLTGPLQVLARLPQSTTHIVAKSAAGGGAKSKTVLH
jgi:hypothetical protein